MSFNMGGTAEPVYSVPEYESILGLFLLPDLSFTTSQRKSKGDSVKMDVLTGMKQKETMEISQLMTEMEGKTVQINGAIHTIRDMGTVAFVVLRKREGLLQCVYVKGIAEFELEDLKEAASVLIKGTLSKNEKAPNGIEVMIESVKNK